jgi:DNA-binding transcriptional LysR family regulator
LVSLVDEGGYVRAAKVLGVTQSTISETIRSLERLAGGPVVRRDKNAISLTSIGDILLPVARRMLALESEALAQLTETAGNATSRITIGCSESISSYLLSASLTAVRRRWRNCRLEVRSAPCTEIRAGIKTGRYNLGLVCEPPARGGEESSKILSNTELVLFCAPDHPLAGVKTFASQLDSMHFHLSDASGSFGDVLASYCRAAGLDAPSVTHIGSVEGVKRAVADDAEVLGLLPLFAVARELEQGALARVQVMPPLPPIVLKALFIPNQPSPVIDVLLQTLVERAGQQSPPRPMRASRTGGGRL